MSTISPAEMLLDLHQELGATVSPEGLILHYPQGAHAEHLHTRASAGLMDLSTQCQVVIRHSDGYGPVVRALEALVPADLLALGDKRQCRTVFTNDAGGIAADVSVAHRGDEVVMILGEPPQEAQLAYLAARLEGCEVRPVTDRAFLALQGPHSALVLDEIAPGCDIMKPLDTGVFSSDYGLLWVSRASRTGEDGYEISVLAPYAERLLRHLLEHSAVQPVGRHAQEGLRIEAGLRAFGTELTPATSLVEAGLSEQIAATRRAGGPRPGGFPGAERVLCEMKHGVSRVLVGVELDGEAPAKADAPFFARASGGTPIGHVTSSSYVPGRAAVLSMGYVSAEYSRSGAVLFIDLQGERRPGRVYDLPKC